MNTIKKHKKILLIGSFLLGVAYYWLVSVSFMISTPEDRSTNGFRFYVGSNISQEVKMQVYAKDLLVSSVDCNGKMYTFSKEENNYPFGEGEEVIFKLDRGLNTCWAYLSSGVGEQTIDVKQKIGYFDFFVLFFLSILPLAYFFFTLFMRGAYLSKECFASKSKMPVVPFSEYRLTGRKALAIYSIILLGIVIRYFYFEKFGVMMHQHDWHSHIELFKYIVDNQWTLPLPMKGLEFPQQPLYYLLAAGIYSIFPGADPLVSVGWMSLLASVAFLYYGYRFLDLVSKSFWVKVVGVSFLSLTPSILYISSRINNDALVLPLAAFSLYYIVLSYRYSFERYFFHGLIGVSLLFWTKISGAPIELLLLVLLFYVFYRSKTGDKVIENRLWWFALVGVLSLSFLLMHSWQPVEQVFNLVNSTEYPGQTLNPIPWNYALTFYFPDLVSEGQCHIFGVDKLRESFLTYQYGTMFLGEFDYKWAIDEYPDIYTHLRMILGFGIVYVVGFVVYLLTLPKRDHVHKILLGVFLVNAFLILKFFVDYPSLCNTDFRYFAATFAIIALMFGEGLYSLFGRHRLLLAIPSILILLLHFSELLFYFKLLHMA